MNKDLSFKLGEGTRETAKAMLEAMISGFVDVERKPDDDYIISEFERLAGALPSLYRMGLVWLFRVLEVAPLAMGFRRQFSNLPLEDRVKVLSAFEKSGNYVQRGLILALKSPFLLLYFSEEPIEQAVEHDHRCLLEVRAQAGRAGKEQ